MNTVSPRVDDFAGDPDRPRRHAIYRLAFGVGGCLIVADALGATFPFLPAKNITFSLMANAVRAADLAF